MPLYTFPAPDPREGERLAAAIKAATGISASVALNADGAWQINTEASEADVKAQVDVHDGTPAPVGPTDAERIAALEAEVKGIKDRAAATTVSDPDAQAVRDAVAGA